MSTIRPLDVLISNWYKHGHLHLCYHSNTFFIMHAHDCIIPMSLCCVHRETSIFCIEHVFWLNCFRPTFCAWMLVSIFTQKFGKKWELKKMIMVPFFQFNIPFSYSCHIKIYNIITQPCSGKRSNYRPTRNRVGVHEW